MAKNQSHLTLVRKGGQDSLSASEGASNAFELVALGELSVAEQKRIERTVAQICPGAPIIGVQVTPRAWDVRPVVMVAREGVPSLIRFLGPEVTLSSSIATRVQETFERIAAFDNLARASLVQDWGLFDGQLWYRRPVVETTLAQTLEHSQLTNLAEALSLARNLIQGIEEFHARGVVHGHLQPSNIFISSYGEVSLLDPGIGIAVAQASLALGLETFPRGYSRRSFAPEVLENESVLFSSDVFGLGQILRHIFSSFAEGASRTAQNRPRNSLTILLESFDSMCEANPVKRPPLPMIKELLGEKGALESAPRAEPARAPSQGRIVKVRRPSQTMRVQGEPVVAPPPVQQTSFSQTSALGEPQPAQPAMTATPVSPVTGAERVKAQPPEPQAQVVAPPAAETESGEPKRLSNRALFGAVLLAVLFVGGLYYSRTGGPAHQFSREELEVAWTSKRPSMMSTVAQAAIDAEYPDKFAEMLIVGSAMRGEQIGSGVDTSLIRIAFDERWERDLSVEDRRLALALALSGLLREKTPRDLPALDTAHAGVILGITASAGENVGAILDKIPVSLLAELPPPIGPAFLELSRHNPDLTCGDEATRLLSRIATRGVEDSDQIVQFVERDTTVRLRALALLYASEPVSARRVLDILLNHPNVEIQHEHIQWAKSWNLLKWTEIENSDQLSLVAGIPPVADVSVQNLGKLFSHPQPSIRGLAIRKAIDQIKFEHPGAYNTLRSLSEHPELLTPAQTVQLAQLLEAFERAPATAIRAWLETQPPQELVAALLVSTSAEAQGTTMDFEFSRYLQGAGWAPNTRELERLAGHPDNLTRFFAYTKIFALDDKAVALQMLTDAAANEKHPEFKRRLELMLASLR